MQVFRLNNETRLFTDFATHGQLYGFIQIGKAPNKVKSAAGRLVFTAAHKHLAQIIYYQRYRCAARIRIISESARSATTRILAMLCKLRRTAYRAEAEAV